MHRGDSYKRLDPHFHLPVFTSLVAKIKSCEHDELGKVVSLSAETREPFIDDFHYIEISSVELGTGKYSTEKITASEAPSRARMVVRSGDILISKTRPHRGAILQVLPNDDNGIASTGFAILREINDRLLRSFLFDLLLTNVVLDQFHQYSAGSSYPAIVEDDIRSVVIPIPSKPVQQELVAQMQAAREQRAARLREADEALAGIDGFLLDALGLTPPPADERTVYAVRLGDLQKNTNSNRLDAGYFAPHYTSLQRALAACPYPKVALGELAADLSGGATPTKGDEELYTDSGIKFLRILNVKPNEIDLNDVKHITEDVHNVALERSQLAADDVLMTITGRVGTAAVVPAEILPANINQHIVRLHLTNAECLPAYLAAYLNSSIGLALSNRGVSGGTRIALDYGTVQSLQIPLPRLDIQERIISEVENKKEVAQQLREQAKQEWTAAKAGFEQKLLN